MRGPKITRLVSEFSAITLGGSGLGGTSKNLWTVETDGEFERQVSISVDGGGGGVLRPGQARRLARALVRAADQAEREQASIDREGWR